MNAESNYSLVKNENNSKNYFCFMDLPQIDLNQSLNFCSRCLNYCFEYFAPSEALIAFEQPIPHFDSSFINQQLKSQDQILILFVLLQHLLKKRQICFLFFKIVH